MKTTELYYPQIAARAGPYTFTQGIEVEVYSSKSSYFDWAKIRFTSQYKPKLSLNRKAPAAIEMGYSGALDEVFSGYVVRTYDGDAYVNEIGLKDDMILLEETIINDTFMDTTPQEMISFFLSRAGITRMKLADKSYPTRRMLPIREQSVIQAINTVNAAWDIKPLFFFSGGVFYWDEKPEQSQIYTFEYGVNIIALNRVGGIWELKTVSVPFVKHSHKINLVHPRISGQFEVIEVRSTTNDSGFIRTYIYF